MNCKQGEVAVIVRSAAGNAGKVVKCLRLLGMKWWTAPNGVPRCVETWAIDRPLRGLDGEVHYEVPDDQLRPIRDQPGEDETLTWQAVPRATEGVK